MSKIKNAEAVENILSVMHEETIGALINAQLTKDNKVASAVDLMRPAFSKFTAEDILDSFIVFALNVAADSLSTKDNQNTGIVSPEEVMIGKTAQA